MTELRLVRGEICVARILWVIGVLLLSADVARAQLPAPWIDGDVGSTRIAGSASSAAGVFTVRGSGADVWSTADGFHFVYRPMTGDGQIVARVDSLTFTDPWAKAGVMMRDGLGPGDANAFALVSAGGAVRLQRRALPGAPSASIFKGTGTMPYWVRLVRTGNLFRAFFSTDGVAWTAGGSTTILMNPTIYVGLAVTSHNQNALATAAFRSVSVTTTPSNQPPVVNITAPADGAQFDAPATIQLNASATDADGVVKQVQFFNGTTLIGTDTTSPYGITVGNVGEGTYTLRAVALDDAGATASDTVTVTVRPGGTPWLNEDVGTVGLAGGATFGLNTVTVRGAGSDIWGTADGFHFVYQTLDGDGEILARVDSLQQTNAWAKAGVMMRDTLSAASSHAFAMQSAASGVGFQRRVTPGGTSLHTPGGNVSAPRWLKLTRQGSTFTASQSADGTTWTVMGTQTIAMQQTVYAGLAVTSHNTALLATAVFSNITLRETTPLPNQPPAVSLTAPAPGATFTAPATIGIAANASDADGTVAQVQFFAGSTLLATDTTSPYSFSWANVPAGSYSLTAVARDNLGATTTSGPVPVAVTAPQNQPPIVNITAPANGAQFDAPATIPITATASDPGGAVSQVRFFNGTTLIGTDTTSPYSATATNLADGTYTLRAEALDNAGATASATVTVTVRPAPSPWSNGDVGTVTIAGSVTHGASQITVRGEGNDIWNTVDGFHFVYQTLNGDGEIVARVDSLENTHEWASAGVMMREALTGSSRHAYISPNAGHGVGFTRRLAAGGESTFTGGSVIRAPRWVRIVRQGSTFTAAESADGVTWSLVGSDTIAMPQTLYVGLAVTSGIPGALTTAVFSNVTLREITPPPNQPPTVAITSPVGGATFTAPATIAIAATASDADGTVAQVQFFAGTTLLGTDTTSPYGFTWTNVPAGAYSLTAVARDNLGATRTSTAVAITVTLVGPPPARVVFNPSPDHGIVTHYLFEVYRSGDVPGTSVPVASLNLGKPPVVNNDIDVDITALIQSLTPGNYIATVSAVNAGGSGRSAPPTAFVR